MHSRLVRLLLIPVDLVVAFVIVLDELVRPLYRPLLAWLGAFRLVARLEAAIGRLPPYGVLAMLAVPFAVAEPLKLFSLLLLARGAWLSGIVTMALGHLTSFVLVERVYQAGRAQLLTIPWFARCMEWLDRIRQVVVERVKQTGAWRRAWALARAVRERARSWLARIRASWRSISLSKHRILPESGFHFSVRCLGRAMAIPRWSRSASGATARWRRAAPAPACSNRP